MTTHYLHKSIVHKNIRVDYLVDFQKKTVSIVNQDRTPKHYQFTNRGLEFMNGWRNILEAVQVAIQEGEALLKEQEEEEFKHFVSVIDCNP